MRVAPLLIAGQAWVIPVNHAPNPWVGKADPSVLSGVNAAHGTMVDFGFLGRYEGGQWTRGYVPIRASTGRVVGASGMTIATGFDIGQWSASDLTDTLGLDQALADKLKLFTVQDGQRYLSLPPAGQTAGRPTAPVAVEPTGNFRGMTKIGVAKVVADTAPVPVPELTKAEADKVDQATHSKILSDAAKA